MADQKLTDKTAFPGSLVSADLIHIVDISDTTQDPAGSSYKLEVGTLFAFISANLPATWHTAGNTLTGTEHTPNEFLGSLNDFDVVFKENNIEVMRIRDGLLGIGTNNPTSKLHISGPGSIVSLNSTTSVGIPNNTSDLNISHNTASIDYISLWNNNLGAGILFNEENAIGMQMINKDGTTIQADIHIFANGSYVDKIRMDGNEDAIYFAGTRGKIRTNGWLRLRGAHGVFDVTGDEGQDIRIATDGNGTNGKGFYLKAFSGSNWRTGIKYLNTLTGEPNLVLVEDGGNVGLNTSVFGTNADGVLAIGNGTEPTTAPANEIQIYSSDSNDGTSTLSWIGEQAMVAEVLACTHTLKVKINGINAKLLLNIP